MVDRLYPSTNPSSGRFRKSGLYATVRGECGNGRGGCINGRGHGRGRGGRSERGIGGCGQVSCEGGRGEN